MGRLKRGGVGAGETWGDGSDALGWPEGKKGSAWARTRLRVLAVLLQWPWCLRRNWHAERR